MQTEPCQNPASAPAKKSIQSDFPLLPIFSIALAMLLIKNPLILLLLRLCSLIAQMRLWTSLAPTEQYSTPQLQQTLHTIITTEQKTQATNFLNGDPLLMPRHASQ